MLFAICGVLNSANIIISSTILTVNAVIAAETCEKLSSIKRAMAKSFFAFFIFSVVTSTVPVASL